jgi:hypothetical protein
VPFGSLTGPVVKRPRRDSPLVPCNCKVTPVMVPPAIKDFGDTVRGHLEIARQLRGAHVECFERFGEMLTEMDGGESLDPFSLRKFPGALVFEADDHTLIWASLSITSSII